MNENRKILSLVAEQSNPDNNIRRSAELELNHISAQDPSAVFQELLQLATDESIPEHLRQACLLNLRLLVPKYWSIGFQSFVGPPVDQGVKHNIRQSLLQLVTTSTSSKLRSGSAYVIIQIAATDYPDEWPDLLVHLYNLTKDFSNEVSVLGGLTVFNDLFDDLITEEQFWEGGVGNEVIQHVLNLLNESTLGIDVKIACVKLYSSILNTLRSPEAFADNRRQAMAHEHVNTALGFFTEMLHRTGFSSNGTELHLNEIYLKSQIYNILSIIVGNYNKRVGKELKSSLISFALKDFAFSSKCYYELFVIGSDSVQVRSTPGLNDSNGIISNCLKDILRIIALLQHSLVISQDQTTFDEFTQSLLQSSVLTQEQIEGYESDFNLYVSDSTELAMTTSVRDVIYELLSELNDFDSKELYNKVITNISSQEMDWPLKECHLYILECLFLNEDANLSFETSPIDLLLGLEKFINLNSEDTNNLLIARFFLMLPKFFEKFEGNVPVNELGMKAFIEMLNFGSRLASESFNLIKAACLVSTTLFKLILDFNNINIDRGFIQLSVFRIAASLVEECEEDSIPAILEAITVSIDIDSHNALNSSASSDIDVIYLIFSLALKDSANVQLMTDTSDCFKSLLHGVDTNEYLLLCDKALPFILDTIKQFIEQGKEDYSSNLDLVLEILSAIIKSLPENAEIPENVFTYTFPLLNKLITVSMDNQILQTAGEVFNILLEKASRYFLNYKEPESGDSGIHLLLTTVSKFLSPDLSDSAAVNSGLIVLSLIDKFHDYADMNFLTQILEATVKRLIIAKEVITIENLIMVFCNLICASPEQMVDFLSKNIKLADPKDGSIKTGLELILPIWFQSFEVTRGYEKIKQNALALAKIYTLNDERIQNLIVDGDLIPYEGDVIRTRSMTKSMPDKYTQISASLKIIKLLISELNFQCQQANNEINPEDVKEYQDDGNEDDWEEIDDVGIPDYEKLKSYVDSDNEDDEHEDQNGDEDLKNLLIQFFKECTTKNLGNFNKYYGLLTDDEKKILTEDLIF